MLESDKFCKISKKFFKKTCVFYMRKTIFFEKNKDNHENLWYNKSVICRSVFTAGLNLYFT